MRNGGIDNIWRMPGRLRTVGMTLVECMIAMALLTIAALGMTFAATTGHVHLSIADDTLRAVRLGEHLLEEIIGRPYDGSGASRATYCVDDYDGFTEPAGTLQDFASTPYEAVDQSFSRSVTVNPSSVTIAALGGAVIPGKVVSVTVRDAQGSAWTLTRFIAEPPSP